jgi:hypothetical protein
MLLAGGFALAMLGVAQAADSAAAEPYADVHIVGPDKYFSAKQANLPISERDTQELIRQDAHALQLALERWSVDNLPSGSNEVTFYPAGDRLDAELNTWHPQYGSYTGKSGLARGTGFYPNPVTAATQRNFDGVALPFGWSAAAPGNFSYLYQVDEQGRTIHYLLLFYGLHQGEGLDVDQDGASDGVLLQLTDGTEHKQAAGRPWYCAGHAVPGIDVAE